MTLTLADCFDYSTKKEVRIQSVPLGILKQCITFGVIVFVCFSLITQKRYQKKDSIISSVHTKVKGFADAHSRIWDTAEYTVPSPGGDSFFVITNIVKTEGQMQSNCSELPSQKTICSRDDICKKGLADPQSNGIQTGRCINFNNTLKTCEVSAWCPVESQTTPVPAVLESAENFTVLIKNNIHFAAFNFTKKNILPNYNVSCIYDRVKAPLCPIFRLGDILREAGENFSQVAVLGGVIGIEINWDCDLDPLRYKCEPHYGFRRLDDTVVDESLYPGLNFRFARYYKNAHGTETRTLIKAYGIRFDIQVYGTGGQFNLLELALFIGSCLSYLGCASFAIDFIIGRYNSCCCNAKSVLKYYDDRKYETIPGPSVSLAHLKAHLKFVSFVDKEDILMVDQKLKGSLQLASGPYIQRERFADTKAKCKDSHKQDENEMRLIKGRSAMLPPAWCKCNKCINTTHLEEQLCCRLEEGECITDTKMFNSLVLNRESLEYAFQYDNPLSKTPISKEHLRYYAKQKYVEWRFGCRKYMLNFAVIPNCCKTAIETCNLQTQGP
uniref:P2X purinoceptor n=1 Tax=Xenopus laevis TaxID=8355 RepID=B7ZRS4_XENLA|nr:ATP gated ion channel [Xenopus laevis]